MGRQRKRKYIALSAFRFFIANIFLSLLRADCLSAHRDEEGCGSRDALAPAEPIPPRAPREPPRVAPQPVRRLRRVAPMLWRQPPRPGYTSPLRLQLGPLDDLLPIRRVGLRRRG